MNLGIILVVEDSADSALIIKSSLGFKFKIEIVGTLAEARMKLVHTSYSLLLIDVLLPDGLGFDLYKEFNQTLERSGTPVIFLTSKNSIEDKYLGFSLGADDYVTKPFDPDELLLRVESQVLRSQRRRFLSENISRGPLRLEVQSMAAYLKVDEGEKHISLTPIEFKLLLHLAQNPNLVLSRTQLLQAIWGSQVFIEDRSIDKHICTLRKKIHPYEAAVKTVSGIGYKFQLS